MGETPNDPQTNDPSGGPDVVLASLADSEVDTGPRRSKWTMRLVILGTLALVLGPLLYAWFPKEISRWYEASAIENYSNGNHEEATADLNKALEWDPENPSAYRQRAEWRLDDRDYAGALEDCNHALEVAAKDTRTLLQRSLALQHLGRHAEAIEDWKKLAELHGHSTAANRTTVLNGLAYARALGNIELDEALADVEKALEIEGDNAAMLDTRGFIYYRRKDMKSAKRDMDAAVKGLDTDLQEARNPQRAVDQRDFKRRLKLANHNEAVIRYHRALVNDKVGEPEQAEQDRQRVRDLGYEPNEKLF